MTKKIPVVAFNLAAAFLVMVGAASATAAAQGSAASPSKDAPVSADDFRCGKFRMESAADLKEKLLDNCIVTRPYSFAMSDMLGTSPTVTYCCMKKPGA